MFEAHFNSLKYAYFIIFNKPRKKLIFWRHLKKNSVPQGPWISKVKKALAHILQLSCIVSLKHTLRKHFSFCSAGKWEREREGGRECVCSNQNLKRSLSSPLPSYTGTECKCRCTAGSRYQLVFQFRLNRHGDQQVLAKIYQLISHILCRTFKGNKEKNLENSFTERLRTWITARSASVSSIWCNFEGFFKVQLWPLCKNQLDLLSVNVLLSIDPGERIFFNFKHFQGI